jgi:hypothetical protein
MQNIRRLCRQTPCQQDSVSVAAVASAQGVQCRVAFKVQIRAALLTIVSLEEKPVEGERGAAPFESIRLRTRSATLKSGGALRKGNEVVALAINY